MANEAIKELLKDFKKVHIENYEQLQSPVKSEIEAKAICKWDYKGYTCFLVDSEPFYYGVLYIYNNNKLIKYNSYVFEHVRTLEAAEKNCLTFIKNHLFTLEELKDFTSYADYRNKVDFLNNTARKHFEHVSAYDEVSEKKKESWYYTPNICFCYFKDKAAADLINNSYDTLYKNYSDRILKDLDLFREAISYELSNHEACITCDVEESLRALCLNPKYIYNKRYDLWCIAIEEMKKQVEWYNNQD